jgi:hypothetical protein
MSKQFRYFTIFNGLHTAAYTALSFFGILNIYDFTGSLLIAILAYAGIYLLYPFVLYWIAPLLGKLGTRDSMLIGTIFLLSSLVPFFFIETYPWLMVPWVFLWMLSRVFYNVSWYYQFCMLSTTKHRGTEVALKSMIDILVEAIVPLITGLLTALYGVHGVVGLCVLLVGAEMMMLLRLQNYHFLYSGGLFRYMQIPRLQNLLLIVGINDAQNFLNVFWHIFIFVIAGSNFAKTGSLVALSVLIGLLFSYFLGHFLDHHNRRSLLRYEAVINSLLWIVRFFASSIAWIVPVDSIYKLNRYLKDEAISTVTTDMLVNPMHEQQLDEKIIVREIVANAVIAIVVLFGLLLALVFGLKAPLLLAAAISLLFVFF